MALFVFCRGGGAGVSACSFFSPTGPLTSPMHANWQARFLAGLAGAAKATKVQLVDAHFANRVIGGVRQESFGEVNGSEDSSIVGCGQSAAKDAAHCPRW